MVVGELKGESMMRRVAKRLTAAGCMVTLCACLSMWSAPASAAPGDADVLVSAQVPTSVPRSSPFTITAQLGNVGPASATNLVVTVTVPDGATYVSANVDGGTCSEASGTVTCSRPALIPFDFSFPRAYVNVVAPDSIGPVTSSMTVAADQPDPDPGNNAATSAEVQVGGSNLALSSPPSCCTSGPEMTLPVDVVNVGPEPATDVEVTAELPAGSALSTYTITGAGTCSALASLVTCALGTLPYSGTPTQIRLVVTTDDPPKFDFSIPIEATTSAFDYNLANNESEIDVFVRTLISVGDASVYEGDGGTRTVKFPVTLIRPVQTQEVTVDYRVVAGSASGGTAGDVDDKAGRTRKLRFTPSASTGVSVVTKTISVTVRSDLAVEGDETFAVVLSNPTFGAGLGHPIGVGTVLDDDPGSGQRVGVGGVSVREGDGGVGKVSVAVTLAQPATSTVIARVTSGGGSAVAGVDYKSLAKLVTFRPGQQTKFVTVTLYRDVVDDGDRTLLLTLSDVAGAVVEGGGVGTVTIVDDD